MLAIQGISPDKQNAQIGFIGLNMGKVPIGAAIGASALITGISAIVSIASFRSIGAERKFVYQAGLALGGLGFAFSGVMSLVNTVLLTASMFVAKPTT